MKCPYCKGYKLYLRRTWPNEKYGCIDCDQKVEIMKEAGMSKNSILKVLKGDVR